MLRTSGIIEVLSALISLTLSLFFSGEREVKPVKISAAYIAFPTFLIGSIHLLARLRIQDCIIWMYENTNMYFFLSVGMSFAGTLGGIIDSMIVLTRYKMKNKRKCLSPKEIFQVVKYGDINNVQKGLGVYDLNPMCIAYGIISNFSGAMCPVSMLIFIKQLPCFIPYLKGTEWIDFYSLFASVMVVPALLQYLSKQKEKYPPNVELNEDNPDIYYMDRHHVLFNSISLWFTNTMVLIFGFTFLSYSIDHIHQYPISLFFVLPIFSLIVFLLHLAFSPVAIEHKAVNVNAYKLGKKIITFIIIATLLMYKFSIFSIIVLAICLAMLAIWDLLIKIIRNKTKNIQKWNSSTLWISLILLLAVNIIAIAVAVQQILNNS